MLWGPAVMGLTGFILWNPIAAAKILPGQFIPAAKAVMAARPSWRCRDLGMALL